MHRCTKCHHRTHVFHGDGVKDENGDPIEGYASEVFCWVCSGKSKDQGKNNIE